MSAHPLPPRSADLECSPTDVDDCATRFAECVPPGDDRVRRVCRDCGFIDYANPKVVVGAVIVAKGRVLLCRRAIAPRLGFWTLPAGHLERSETAEEGAVREAWEEARARIAIESLLGVWSSREACAVQIVYRACLIEPTVERGAETSELAWADLDAIPWRDLAFPSDTWALVQLRRAS